MFKRCDIIFSTSLHIASDQYIDVNGNSICKYVNWILCDEASESTEPALLPAINMFDSNNNMDNRLILCGDHKQLPPQIRSIDAKKLNLEISMFKRLLYQNIDKPQQSINHQMLQVQYRMHPSISAFSSQNFYDNEIINGENTKTILKPYCVNLPKSKSKDYRVIFIDITNSEEKQFDLSKINEIEAESIAYIIINMFRKIYFNKNTKQYIADKDTMLKCIEDIDCGVIVAYKAQQYEIEKVLAEKIKWYLSYNQRKIRFNLNDNNINNMVNDIMNLIEINTIDAFQGREKKIIILDWIRANDEAKVGFIESDERANVAITRAIQLLIAVGNRDTLKEANIINKFIQHIESQCPDAIKTLLWVNAEKKLYNVEQYEKKQLRKRIRNHNHKPTMKML